MPEDNLVAGNVFFQVSSNPIPKNSFLFADLYHVWKIYGDVNLHRSAVSGLQIQDVSRSNLSIPSGHLT